MSDHLSAIPISYSLWVGQKDKKRGIWLTVEPNIAFKLATLTPDGEKYLENFTMELGFRRKSDD
jgi:hypothetical protein